ncbi:MAG: alpha/beta fold hydrolase [Gammaproteobacteria bacterium]|nr:alpha/beta fold hydrolase [Gammaproteobacteria bacterium]
MNRPASFPALLEGEERRITVPGATLAGRAWGNPDGPRFLALHGWLDNANSHNALAPLLPELHIVALDFAGHGHSTHRPPGTHYVPLADIQDVIAAADAMGWDRFGLIGHSMGAAIASETAGLFPERITRALFIDGMVHHQGSAADCNDRNRTAIEQMLRAHEKRPPVYPDTEAMVERVSAATDQSSGRGPGAGRPRACGGGRWRHLAHRSAHPLRHAAADLLAPDRRPDGGHHRRLPAARRPPGRPLVPGRTGAAHRAPSEPDLRGDGRPSSSPSGARSRRRSGPPHPPLPGAGSRIRRLTVHPYSPESTSWNASTPSCWTRPDPAGAGGR